MEHPLGMCSAPTKPQQDSGIPEMAQAWCAALELFGQDQDIQLSLQEGSVFPPTDRGAPQMQL